VVFAYALNHHTWRDTASLITWTIYNRQQSNFGMCYVVARAYSLEQQKVWPSGGLTLGFAMHLVIMFSIKNLCGLMAKVFYEKEAQFTKIS